MSHQHLHIIGICGVATSALAIAFKDQGWKVTGSDKGFYPPVSTELEKAGIPFYAGWHPENMGKPDIVIAGGVGTSPSNPEIIYAKENQIPLLSFAEAIGKYFIKENSIVVSGTWGKTTISSLLSFILMEAGKDPSYFTGGVSLSHKAGAMGKSDWSVVEGDEYQAAIWDKKAKFYYYRPTHLLLTSVSWDHADLYPTEESYFQAFRDLVGATKILVVCNDDLGIKKVLNNRKAVTYGKSSDADYYYHSVGHTKKGLDFSIDHQGKSWEIHSPMLGRFNAENITASFSIAHEIGIEPKVIVQAIKDFRGIRRRFEKRYEGKVDILDCHAPTPEKAMSVLESVREVYKNKIFAVYEPNIGGRQRETVQMYDDAFKNADIVILPRFTKLKISENRPLEGKEIKNILEKTHKHIEYIEDDEKLVQYVESQAKEGDVVVFLGSHGFRGMIEEVITSLRQQSL